jgi:hypothetical protein
VLHADAKRQPENPRQGSYVAGSLTSMINNVSAIANTPTQKASNRELAFASPKAHWLLGERVS